jgi:beta-galactosidase/beta-glucuronidase
LELDNNWKCKNIREVHSDGPAVSRQILSTEDWLPATVPGTILTTLLNNGKVPDPFYGMNNELIPDIYDSGNAYYTYWFVNDFDLDFPAQDEQVWLQFRGINYSCDVFLNGQKLNRDIHKGMFLRQSYNITSELSGNGKNRLAVIVFPPDPPGNPNGGQGGDGVIGRNVSHQYVAGWDWIQPVRDRNTGIWDKVTIERTKQINILDPHVVTLVPGKRHPNDPIQEAVLIKISAGLENPTGKNVEGKLTYNLETYTGQVDVSIPAGSTVQVKFPDLTFNNPKLWWPNGYGPQSLYDLAIEFHVNEKILSDMEMVRFGIREIRDEWNPATHSMATGSFLMPCSGSQNDDMMLR